MANKKLLDRVILYMQIQGRCLHNLKELCGLFTMFQRYVLKTFLIQSVYRNSMCFPGLCYNMIV